MMDVAKMRLVLTDGETEVLVLDADGINQAVDPHLRRTAHNLGMAVVTALVPVIAELWDEVKPIVIHVISLDEILKRFKAGDN